MMTKNVCYEQLMLYLLLNGIKVIAVNAYDLSKSRDEHGILQPIFNHADICAENLEKRVKCIFDYASDVYSCSSLEVHKSAIFNDCFVFRLYSKTASSADYFSLLYEAYLYYRQL